MSTLRVDNIKSRTGTEVNIPAGQSLVVSGIGSIIGELKVGGGLTVTGTANVIGDLNVPSGNLTVGGNLSLTGDSSFNLPTGIGTFGTVGAGDSIFAGTTTKVFLHGDNPSGNLQLRNSSGVRYGVDGPTPNLITADSNLASNTVYFVDTSGEAGAGGSITVTLPEIPAIGDYIQVSDYKGTWSDANCVVKINASAVGAAAVIHGKQEDLECNVKHAVATLTYTGISSTGWIVK
tara:strand:+ start:430 stop:1131 length:702 start_codon:yes stop_codon:yes gene_type:complete